MKLLGLTGGIGTGKSTAARRLASQGVAVIDTDDVAREVVAPGQPALELVAQEFGRSILDSSGALDRRALANVVFTDPIKRQRLETILHPRIRERWLAETEQWRTSEKPVGVVVIPLLFETGAETHFDSVICTACTAATQRERLAPRSWSEEEINSRIAAQWPLEKKMGASQHVIWTECDLAVHYRQLALLLDKFVR